MMSKLGKLLFHTLRLQTLIKQEWLNINESSFVLDRLKWPAHFQRHRKKKIPEGWGRANRKTKTEK